MVPVAPSAPAKSLAPGRRLHLLFHHIGMSTAPALYRKLDFKPLDDFIPIGAVVDVPMTLIAKPQTAQTNVKDPVAYIRANKERSIWPTLASVRRRTFAACCSRAR